MGESVENVAKLWSGERLERVWKFVGALIIFIVVVSEAARLAQYSGPRFKTDNAYGATANAVETLRFCLWLLAGFACFIVAKPSEIARPLSSR